MEKQGLVKRKAHPADARARTVSLTAMGRREFQKLWMAGEPIRVKMHGLLKPNEAATLVKLLTRVAASLAVEALPADAT
jgi:DNA-binding MarR family transcriptional regulator